MSDDTKELIERLRDAAARKWPDPDVARHSLFAEAADTIARLESERDAARETARRLMEAEQAALGRADAALLLLGRALAADEGDQVLGVELADAIRAAMQEQQ